MRRLAVAPFGRHADVVFGFASMATAWAAAIVVLEVWRGDIHVPFVYSDDAVLNLMLVKGILQNGWYYENPDLGAPLGQRLYDFPVLSGDHLNVALLKLLGLASDDPAAVTNVFYLLTFGLAALTAFVVLRRLGVSPAVALVCSSLYALLPYHFVRAEHLLLSAYYAVPLASYLVLAVLQGEPLFVRRERRGSRWFGLASKRTMATLAICAVLVTASGSFYYAAFTVTLLAGATVVAAVLRRGRRAVVSGAVAIGLICVGLTANLAPTIAYRLEHGPNTSVAHRGVAENEIFALKLTQLVLPIEEHRIGALSRLSSTYAERAPFGELGRSVHLGIVGSVGFAWLLVVAVAAVAAGATGRFGATYRHAAVASLIAFLIGTVGGLSGLIAAAVTPQFRGWNRISIFIGFFALVAVAAALTSLGQRWQRRGKHRIVFAAVVVATLVVGVLDQTSTANAPNYGAIRREYHNDAQFVLAIEDRLPRNADVFQLPYVPFPEAGMTGAMGDYDLARPYLHAHGLRWSFGAMKGRPEDWQAQLAEKPIAGVLRAVASAGFEALYIDRFGYTDHAAALESRVSSVLGGMRPLVSTNGRFSFFDLRDYSRDAG